MIRDVSKWASHSQNLESRKLKDSIFVIGESTYIAIRLWRAVYTNIIILCCYIRLVTYILSLFENIKK